MNYIAEINAFHDSLLYKQVSTGQIALWYSLMAINNKTGWQQEFTVANQVLELYTGLSRAGVLKARNALAQNGYITFKTRGTKATAYTITDLTIEDSKQAGMQTCTQDGMQTCTQDCMQNSTPLVKPNKTKRNKTIKSPLPPSRFPEFWNAYPNHKAKLDAEKAWKKLEPDDALVDRILEDVRMQSGTYEWTKEAGRFVPRASTYLNGHRWEDETCVPVDAWTAIGMQMGAL